MCERTALSGFRVHSRNPLSELSVLIDLTTKSVKKVMFGPPAAVDLVLCSTRSSACGWPVVVRSRMTRGRLRMACGRLRMAKFPKRVVSGWPGAIYGWPGLSLQAVHGWRERPVRSREAAMCHYTSRWQRGPPPPSRRAGADPWQIPGRASCAGFTGAHSRYHGLQIAEKSLGIPKSRLFVALRHLRVWALHMSAGSTLVGNCGGSRDQTASARRIRTSRCLSRHPSWSLLLFVVKQVKPAPFVEYVTLASAVTYAHASLVVEYVTPAPTVVYASPVTTRTATPTVFPTATVPISKLRQVPTGQTAQQTAEILQLRLLDQVVSMSVVAVQTVQPVEIPQLQFLDTDDMPVVVQ